MQKSDVFMVSFLNAFGIDFFVIASLYLSFRERCYCFPRKDTYLLQGSEGFSFCYIYYKVASLKLL